MTKTMNTQMQHKSEEEARRTQERARAVYNQAIKELKSRTDDAMICREPWVSER